MTPLDRRRRRRRRFTASTVVTLAVVALALFLVVGGAAHVGQASTQFDRSVNRSYAAEGSVLAEQSNQTGAEFRRLMGSLASPSLSRLSLEQSLDSLAQATAQEHGQALGLTPPEPSAGVAAAYSGALAERARAVSEIRGTVDRLLASSPAASPARGAPAALSTPQAVTALASAGAALGQADRLYASARHTLATAPGRGRLVPSVWVQNPAAWTPGPLTTLLGEMTTSSSLAPDTALELTAVRLDPSVLPEAPATPGTPGTPSGAEVVPPTSQLRVDVTVDNTGNTDQPAATASASITPEGSGRPASSTRTFPVAAGTSVAIALAPLPVSPGRTYALSVVVPPPAAQVDRNGLSLRFSVHIAPGT